MGGICSKMMKRFRLLALVSVTTAIGLTKEAVDDCETLDCLSDIVSNVFGLEKAPPAEDGFLATWVWYENIRQKLRAIGQKELPRIKRAPINHRNFYSMMKSAKYL